MIGLMMLAAAVAAPEYTVHYPGTRSCGEWTADRTANSASSVTKQIWVNGFITGYNRYGPPGIRDIIRGTDVNGAYAWIDNYCRAHPLLDLADATEALVKELVAGKR